MNAQHPNKSVIVYGPQGCGKTLNANLMKEHFGLRVVSDIEGRKDHPLAATDFLYLTNMTRDDLVARGYADDHSRRVFAYDDVMAQINGARAADATAVNMLVSLCHGASAAAGWW